ncbi:MAG: hypothetical protein HY200_00540 [Nitrospirae bacterium]|nr:hypothetical protein [Nitrospirota bacterium]MBI3593425.1 hypothetical protein [Nitrospirota bacterium]
MLIGTSGGGEMLQNELLVLQIIVGIGFIGWMMLMYVHTVLLSNSSGEEIGGLKNSSRNEKDARLEFKKAA